MFQLSYPNIVRSLAALTALPTVSLMASPMLTLSDNSAVYFVGSASITSDSNIGYASEDELDDLILEIRPGFEWVAGNPEVGADFTLSASYGLRRYMDNDEFNSELPAVVAEANFQSAKSKTTLSASYVESMAESRRYNVPGLILKTTVANVGVSSDFRPTEKSSVVAGVSYSDTSHDNLGTDFSNISVPVNYYYRATEKLDAGFGYRYKGTSIDSVSTGDLTSHFFNVGLKGELSPKMVADVKVGFQTTDIDGGDSVDGLALEGSLTFVASEKASIDLSVSKDLAVGFSGEVIDNFTAAISGNYQFSDAFFGNASLAMGKDDFKSSDREDDYTVFQVGLSYIPVYYMSIEAAYMLMDNDSSGGVLDFTKNTFKLMVNVRY